MIMKTVVALMLLATPVAAQDYDLTITSDNRSKGLTKSNGEAALLGSVSWSEGIYYVAPAFETIEGSTGSDLEVKLAAGVRPEFAGFKFDLNAAWKYQVDVNPGVDNGAWEFTADAARSIGPIKTRLRVQYTPDSIGSAEEWTWYEARAGIDLTDRLSAAYSIGRREQVVDYTAWSTELNYKLTDNVTAGLYYYSFDDTVTTNIRMRF